MREVSIHTEYIQLDQLLKWDGIVDTNGQVKYMLEDGLIYLNHQIVTERRKKIRPGDIVEIKGIATLKIVSSPE